MPPTEEPKILSIAAIRKPRGGRPTEYLFNERAEIFTTKEIARPRAGARVLRKALSNNLPVKVRIDSRRSFIKTVELAKPEEIDLFRKEKALLDKPEKVFRFDAESIDPTKFNVVDHGLRIPAFLLCKRVIPSYRKAKAIFDFCANQSCHLHRPEYDIDPCIPFQYVRDGCYARAHKMRWIVRRRYRYCCEKIFSFANQGNDRLAVRADKWGGCCVTWWYHVAPLVRVKVKLPNLPAVTLAMVLDPGMFDKPVLMSSWLSAQENMQCSASANVSMWSVQPGSAYAPANYEGTAYSTDPDYVQTDATLQAYSGLVTCP